MMNWFALLVLSSLMYHAAESCSNITENGVTLNGTCPNDTKIVPVGGTAVYQCTYDSSGSQSQTIIPFWNITGYGILFFSSLPSISIPTSISPNTGTTYLIITLDSQFTNTTVNINCGLCELSACSSAPVT